MSRRRIESRRDLQDEMDRLRAKSRDLEKQLHKDVFDIRESIRPVSILRNLLESLTGIRFDKDDIRNNTLTALLLLAFKKIISKAESKAEDNVYLFFDKLFNSIRNFLAKYFNVRKHRGEGGVEEEQTSNE